MVVFDDLLGAEDSLGTKVTVGLIDTKDLTKMLGFEDLL